MTTITTETPTATFTKADIALVFAARQARLTHPAGTFDKQGRWYPATEEDSYTNAFCVRAPSKAWPFSYMTAARTRKHVAALTAFNPTYFAKLLAEAQRIQVAQAN